jgi:hypothetical protein
MMNDKFYKNINFRKINLFDIYVILITFLYVIWRIKVFWARII